MSFTLKIDPEWNIIKKIKELINKDPVVLAHGSDFREAVLLTAIELVENGLKYSDGEVAHPVEFQFETTGAECVIRVTNTASSTEHRKALEETLERVRQSNPFELYVERLEKIRDNPDGFSRMGLIRIAYEGEFALSVESGPGNAVSIIARRPLPAGAA